MGRQDKKNGGRKRTERWKEEKEKVKAALDKEQLKVTF